MILLFDGVDLANLFRQATQTQQAGANPAGTNPAGANPAGANPAGANPAGGGVPPPELAMQIASGGQIPGFDPSVLWGGNGMGGGMGMGGMPIMPGLNTNPADFFMQPSSMQAQYFNWQYGQDPQQSYQKLMAMQNMQPPPGNTVVARGFDTIKQILGVIGQGKEDKTQELANAKKEKVDERAAAKAEFEAAQKVVAQGNSKMNILSGQIADLKEDRDRITQEMTGKTGSALTTLQNELNEVNSEIRRLEREKREVNREGLEAKATMDVAKQNYTTANAEYKALCQGKRVSSDNLDDPQSTRADRNKDRPTAPTKETIAANANNTDGRAITGGTGTNDIVNLTGIRGGNAGVKVKDLGGNKYELELLDDETGNSKKITTDGVEKLQIEGTDVESLANLAKKQV